MYGLFNNEVNGNRLTDTLMALFWSFDNPRLIHRLLQKCQEEKKEEKKEEEKKEEEEEEKWDIYTTARRAD